MARFTFNSTSAYIVDFAKTVPTVIRCQRGLIEECKLIQ